MKLVINIFLLGRRGGVRTYNYPYKINNLFIIQIPGELYYYQKFIKMQEFRFKPFGQDKYNLSGMKFTKLKWEQI